MSVRTIAVDLTSPDALVEITAATADLEVGLLICNAGANTCSAQFLDGELDAFDRVIELNVNSVLALVHHFGRPMRERRRGGILLVGSMAGYMGSARHTVYGGVKAFSRIFAESLWLELLEYDVHVLELVLGVTRTPAMHRVGLNFDAPGHTCGGASRCGPGRPATPRAWSDPHSGRQCRGCASAAIIVTGRRWFSAPTAVMQKLLGEG